MESEKTDWLVVAKWLIDWLMNDWLIFSDHSFEDKKNPKNLNQLIYNQNDREHFRDAHCTKC